MPGRWHRWLPSRSQLALSTESFWLHSHSTGIERHLRCSLGAEDGLQSNACQAPGRPATSPQAPLEGTAAGRIHLSD